MTKDEALNLALDALETSMYPQQKQLQAITAIKAALEAKDEPVAWMDASRFEELRNGFTVMTTLTKKKAFFDDIAIYTTPPQQEAKDEPWEKFCDSNCVWTDHHPDCKLAKDEPVAWCVTYNGELTGNIFENRRIADLCKRNLEAKYGSEESREVVPIYTTPPQRKPLSDEELTEIFSTTKGLDFYLNFARAIEAAHGIKGEA